VTIEKEETRTSAAPPSSSEVARTVNDEVSKALDDVLANRQLMALIAK
jgi:hypothetical protein